MIVLIILSGISLLMLVLGIMIKHFKCYWLISGYNTASYKEQEKYDIESLSKVMGNGLFALSSLLFVAGFFQYIGLMQIYIIVMISILFPIGYMVIKGRRYGPKYDRQ